MALSLTNFCCASVVRKGRKLVDSVRRPVSEEARRAATADHRSAGRRPCQGVSSGGCRRSEREIPVRRMEARYEFLMEVAPAPAKSWGRHGCSGLARNA